MNEQERCKFWSDLFLRMSEGEELQVTMCTNKDFVKSDFWPSPNSNPERWRTVKKKHTLCKAWWVLRYFVILKAIIVTIQEVGCGQFTQAVILFATSKIYGTNAPQSKTTGTIGAVVSVQYRRG